MSRRLIPTIQKLNTAREQIISIFAACLPVLKARIANLSMAQDLVDSALENASLSLQMESLGFASLKVFHNIFMINTLLLYDHRTSFYLPINNVIENPFGTLSLP
jgi:hypothetical protein